MATDKTTPFALAQANATKKPDYASAVEWHNLEAAEEQVQERLLQEFLRERDKHIVTLKRQAGSRLAECRFSTFQISKPYQATVVDALREWVETITERMQRGEGLVLYGPVGTGKDHLAFAAVGEAVFKTGASVRWVNGREMAGAARDRIAQDALEKEFVQELVNPQVLVISDPLPPVGDLTPYQADMLYRVIDRRYGLRGVTVVTLNVADDAEADRRLGAATWDRLCDGSWKIACKWPSYRRPAKDIKPFDGSRDKR